MRPYCGLIRTPLLVQKPSWFLKAWFPSGAKGILPGHSTLLFSGFDVALQKEVFAMGTPGLSKDALG